jgi:hypothetical protein
VVKKSETMSADALRAQKISENAVATTIPASTAGRRPSSGAAHEPVSHTTPAAASALGRRPSVSSTVPNGAAISAISQYESSGLSP